MSRPKLRLVPLLAATLLTAACGVTDPGATSGPSGSYALVSVDGVAPPTTISTGLAGVQLNVQGGTLAFTNAIVSVTLTGAVPNGPASTQIGAQGVFTQTETGFTSDGGISGEIMSDTAAVTTTAATALGAHVYRFGRPSSN